MARLDKTYYKSKKEWEDAYQWAKKHWLEQLVQPYVKWKWDRVLWNTWDTIDRYIWKHCNIPFIKDRLKYQYWNMWPLKWRILVKRIDDWDSTADVTETILWLDIYTATYVDILKEISYEYYNWELRDCIRIISITNLYL